MATEVDMPSVVETVDERLARVVALHFDPQWGSAYWLERAAELNVDPRREIRTLADLALLGEMTPADLDGRPLLDFLPRALHQQLAKLVVAQTGGTTGLGHWTAYRLDEFDEAFVTPFVVTADHVGFPSGQQWLFIGPSGPHIIGKAVRHLATAMNSPDPFSVDFDPRWARRLPDGSFARQRYVQHVCDQAMAVIDSQEIGVLFCTPVVLEALAVRMTAAQRDAIRGVHYGGMALSTEQLLRFQRDLFPHAVHLSGYGNTLFGCCLELSIERGRTPAYFPYGSRLVFDVIDPETGSAASAGMCGHVCFTRLDETMLIVRCLERDVARLVDPPTEHASSFVLPGVLDPQPATKAVSIATIGIY